ncbi:EamA family transporter [soil metagenome]
MTDAEHRQHRAGLAMIAGAALAWSTAGIFVRLIGADLMTMLFWRGLFSGTAVFILYLILERGRPLRIAPLLRWPVLAVAVSSASGMFGGIGAIRHASVADVMVIYATVPFITAGVAWLTIGERPSRNTMIASALALAGVLIMLQGSGFEGSPIGKVLALIMTLGMVSMTIIMRRHRDVPMLPAMGASAWLCAFAAFWFAQPLAIAGDDFILCALFGICQNGLGLALYAVGSRRIPAAEATLIAALEVPLTPFWVWFFLSETPVGTTLVGGAVVLAALFGHMALELRRGRPVLAPVPPQV